MNAAAFLAETRLRRVLDALPGARVVGGAVRDLLAGRPVADIDIATPDTPETVRRRLDLSGIRTIPTGLAHGTVTALVDGVGFEVTTLRRDVATDGRHAETEWTADWREDAERRDFTINAMSLKPDGTLFDPFGGADDLRQGRVRFVGEPAARIEEDYLRILRFFRFHARYGKGPPDETAMRAIATHLDGMARLSAERVWSELARILVAVLPGSDGGEAAIAVMAEAGVLQGALPEFAMAWEAASARFVAAVRAGLPADALLRLAVLMGPRVDADGLARRLRLSGAELARLTAWRAAPVLDLDADDAAIRRALAGHDHAALTGRLWIEGRIGAAWDELRARVAIATRPVFPLEGRDVVALGVAPGPAVGEALRAVRSWWLDGGCVADADACRAKLEERLFFFDKKNQKTFYT